MAVVAEFTATKTSGLVPPSEAIQFADLSTGNPDSWLWDFGDGGFSDQQHPLHTFEGDVLDTFTVKLTAWIADTPNILTYSTERWGKSPTPSDPITQSYANYIAAAWGAGFGNEVSYQVYRYFPQPIGTFSFRGHRVLRNYTLPAVDGLTVAYVVENKLLDVVGGTQEGSYRVLIDGGIVRNVNAVGAIDVYSPTANITALAPGLVIYQHRPNDDTILSDPPLQQWRGVAGDGRVIEHKVSASENKDDEEKVNYITFGAPPIADFGANPQLVGDGGLVQFINLSTWAIGLPTNFVWKRRKTGSGDAFVQFSTAQNPSLNFGK